MSSALSSSSSSSFGFQNPSHFGTTGPGQKRMVFTEEDELIETASEAVKETSEKAEKVAAAQSLDFLRKTCTQSLANLRKVSALTIALGAVAAIVGAAVIAFAAFNAQWIILGIAAGFAVFCTVSVIFGVVNHVKAKRAEAALQKQDTFI
jgi:hypothetical protein